MNKRFWAWTVVIGINALFVLLVFHPFRKAPLFDFSGPEGISEIAAEPPTPLSKYGAGTSSRLAILVDQQDSAWLGLAHGLKSIGVPFIVTSDYQAALKHKVVLVYPLVSGSVLSPEALQALAAHPRQGGTIIAQNVLGGGLEEVFGFEEAVSSRTRLNIQFAEQQPGGLVLSDPSERTLRLGDSPAEGNIMGTVGYTRPREIPLAEFDDGTAAFVGRSIGQGAAYALGLDIGYYILKGYNGRGDGLVRSYVNEYEPAVDVFLRWLRAVYRNAEPDSVTLGTVPDGKDFSLVITHDIDAQTSLGNSAAYARLENSRGIRATYFVQAKYIKDWNDEPFLDQRSAGQLAELSDLGMEIGSHSVCHSIIFQDFSNGTGRERYPRYHPVVVNEKKVTGATVLGELRVSKFLLEKLGRHPVTSFRPGFLRNPRSLPEALLATGYPYSSTAMAGDSLTHFPFQLNFNRDLAAEVPIFEFPVTIDDTTPLSLEELYSRSVGLIGRIAREGGACVLLIHPNVVGDKLDFEKKLLDAVQAEAWTGTIGEFGEWWAARNAVSLDVETTDRGKTVVLEIPSEIRGLSLQVPPAWKLEKSIPEGVARSQSSGTVLLSRASGKVSLFFLR